MCVHVCISCSISPFLHIPLTAKVTPRIPVGPLRFLCASFNKTPVRLVTLDLYHINAYLIISLKIRFFRSANLFFSTIKVTVTVMTVQFIYKIIMNSRPSLTCSCSGLRNSWIRIQCYATCFKLVA